MTQEQDTSENTEKETGQGRRITTTKQQQAQAAETGEKTEHYKSPRKRGKIGRMLNAVTGV